MLDEDRLIRRSMFPLEHRIGLSLCEVLDGIAGLLLSPFRLYTNFACRYSRLAVEDIAYRYSRKEVVEAERRSKKPLY